jgi:alkyl sulfatase BDS1-like metallo-beta-lactamase superfamily hydrolase
MALLAACTIAVACALDAAPPNPASEAASPKPASEATVAANAAVLKELPFQDTLDFQDAMRGFIVPLPNNGAIASDEGMSPVPLKDDERSLAMFYATSSSASTLFTPTAASSAATS